MENHFQDKLSLCFNLLVIVYFICICVACWHNPSAIKTCQSMHVWCPGPQIWILCIWDFTGVHTCTGVSIVSPTRLEMEKWSCASAMMHKNVSGCPKHHSVGFKASSNTLHYYCNYESNERQGQEGRQPCQFHVRLQCVKSQLHEKGVMGKYATIGQRGL